MHALDDDSTPVPFYKQLRLTDVRVQIDAEGMVSLHGVDYEVFENLPGRAHVVASGTAWKQYGAVTFFRLHPDEVAAGHAGL